MKIELNNLDELKGKNPFKVPEGYMQNLTSQVMDQLPEKPVAEARKVSLMDRIRPWVYMAAMFAGLGLFFRFFVVPEGKDIDNEAKQAYEIANTLREEEDDEFFDYLQTQYAGVLLADEWKNID